MIMLFISFNKKILMLVGTVRLETSNIIEETVSTYNMFKERIFEEVNKGTARALVSEKYINRVARGFFVNGI